MLSCYSSGLECMFDYYDEQFYYLLQQLGVNDHPIQSNCYSVKNSTDNYFARRRKIHKSILDSYFRRRDVSRANSKWRAKKDRRIGVAESSVDSSSMGTVDIRQGIQLTSREITSVAERPMYSGDHDMSDATIKELPWDLSRIVERPTLVTAMQWTSDQSSVLYFGSVPASVLPIKIARIPFETFQYWRGDVTLRLQVAGSPIVQGILAMTFVPLVNQLEMNSISWDFSSLSINPTVYLYANTNTHAELRIPYNHFQSYLDTNFPQDPLSVSRAQNLGYVQIYVLEPLLTVGSVTSVTISLFSIFENNQFKVPRISSAISAIGRAESGILHSALSSLTEAGSNILAPAIEEIGTHVKSLISKKSKGDPLTLIAQVASKALPSNFIGDALDVAGGMLEGAMGFLGLDNPTLPTELGRTIVKSNGSMNYAIGPEHIEKLSVLPSAMSLVTPETFATVTDEMDVNYLYRRYSYVGRFEVDAGLRSGTVVWSAPLSPFPTFLNDEEGHSILTYGTIAQRNVWFPLISYLGLPYRYWTGGLKYKFLVSASSLHTCRLFVSFNYGVYVPPESLLDASSQYGVAIEISQGSNEFEFAVPYVALQPYLEVCRGPQTSLNSMGYLNVVVLNPLVAPVTIAPKISVAVYIAGSDDFSYEWLAQVNPMIPTFVPGKPSGNVLPLNNAAEPLLQSATRSNYRAYTYSNDIGLAESGLLETQSIAPTNIAPTVTDQAIGDEDDKDDQVSPPQLETCVDDHFGITSISLRNLLKKYQLTRSYVLTRLNVLSDDYRLYVKVPLRDALRVPLMTNIDSGPWQVPDTPNTGLLSWTSAMFRQFKGSIRYKVVISCKDSTITPYMRSSVYYLPGPEIAGFYDTTQMTPSDAITMYGVDTNFMQSGPYFYPTFMTPRLCILNGVTSNVLEFEVPYSSPYLSVLTYSGDDDNDRYHGLGSVYITVDSADSSGTIATVYAALGDESRFGNLYRIPSIYTPAMYNTDSLGHMAPSGNFAFGDFSPPVSTRPRSRYHSDIGSFEKIGFAESGLLDSVSNFGSDRSNVASLPTNPQSGTGRIQPKPSLMPYVVRRVRRFIGREPSVSYQDIAHFIDNISCGVINSRSYGGIISKAGGVTGRDGMIQLSMASRYRKTNRRRRVYDRSVRTRTFTNSSFNNTRMNDFSDNSLSPGGLSSILSSLRI